MTATVKLKVREREEKRKEKNPHFLCPITTFIVRKKKNKPEEKKRNKFFYLLKNIQSICNKLDGKRLVTEEFEFRLLLYRAGADLLFAGFPFFSLSSRPMNKRRISNWTRSRSIESRRIIRP